MKQLILIALSLLSIGSANAQKLNNKGLYINDNETSPALFNGELFNGVISEIKNGIKGELTVREGVVEGPSSYYYASGKLMESGTFTQGQKDGKWARYNESGLTLATAFYHLGKKTGTWTVYDETGKKRFEMNYSDGEKTGIWTSWDEDGIAITKDYSQAN